MAHDSPPAPPPPGTVQIVSLGTGARSAVAVMGDDGKWHQISTARSLTLRVTADGPVALFLEIMVPHANIVATPPHVSWNYATDDANPAEPR
jgi:hypothetical protein